MRTRERHQGILSAALLAAILLLASCGSGGSGGSGSSGSGGSGSVTFSLQMPTAKAVSSQVYKDASIACDDLGIESVEAYVYDENHNLLASGGPWACNTGGGMIYGVKSGSNRSVEVILRLADGSVGYRGSVSRITVRARRTTDAGIIEIEAEDENLPPVASNDQATVNMGGEVTVLDSGDSRFTANDTDPEGESLTIDTSPVRGPTYGTLTLYADGTFRYVHDGSSSSLADSFTYRVYDPEGKSSTAEVHITVDPDPNSDPSLAEGMVSPESGHASDTYTYTAQR